MAVVTNRFPGGRVEAERARAESHNDAERLKAIVESSDDAIISKDLDGVIQTWNAGAERIFGYLAEEVIGKPLIILNPPGREDEEPAILSRIRRGERVDHFETVRRRKDGAEVHVEVTVSPIKDGAGRIVGASHIARDITERKRAQEQQALLMGEMRHRIKNILATVQAIAVQTLRNTPPADREAFLNRLISLSRAHDLLTAENWSRASLRDVVQQVLEPFREKHHARIAVEGAQDIYLEANKAMLLALALHELATNAVKYGALSGESGTVRLSWELASQRFPQRLALSWKESGGPPVSPPEKKGFGSTLIERALGDLGRADFQFAPTGVTCTLDIGV